MLFCWEGLEATELAGVLGAPVSTMTTRLSRARKSLRETIECSPAIDALRASLLGNLDGWIQSIPTLEIQAATPTRP